MPAELAVGGPISIGFVEIEGQVIDEGWFAAMELDVVQAGILQHHAVAERMQVDVQGQERGILDLTKTPFGGIGNEIQK